MKKMLFVLLSCFAISAFAETSDYQIWAPVNINKKFDDNWRGFLELQARVGDDASQLKTAIVRPAVGYQFHPDWTAWVGYLMQATSKSYDLDQYDIENRAWQGLTYKHKFDDIIFEARNRMEERFLANNSDPEYRWRTRFRVEKLLGTSPLSIIASEEIFFNLNDNDTNHSLQRGADQNRAYIGVGYRIGPSIQVESGYLKQYIWGYSGKQNQNNDVWMTNLNLNF